MTTAVKGKRNYSTNICFVYYIILRPGQYCDAMTVFVRKYKMSIDRPHMDIHTVGLPLSRMKPIRIPLTKVMETDAVQQPVVVDNKENVLMNLL